MFDQMAISDFRRALNRATWRKILNWLKGADNQLLPYDEVRARIPVRGQHYIGLKQVPIAKIVGSMGRYNDFDRAFMPIQDRTKERWISIDKAHYNDIILPPVELIKIGEVYFVKDGNHRVSVARERGQIEIDAYVTEVDIPIKLTEDVQIKDLDAKKIQADFMLATGLYHHQPAYEIELTDPQVYDLLLEHIATHRWYLGIEQKREIPYEEAAVSWYNNVYKPLVQEIQAHDLLKAFKGSTETDLYIWIMEYEKYLRLAFADETVDERLVEAIASDPFIKNFPKSEVSKLIKMVNQTAWLNQMFLDQEREKFIEQTHLLNLRPSAIILTTLPGKYDRLLDHIATHRWYLGEHRKAEVSYEEAVISWYDNVYMPIVQVIREQAVLDYFPNRTETDLYLWIVKHQWYLREAYGEEVPIDQAAEEVIEKLAENITDSTEKRIEEAIKKAAGEK